MDQALAHFSTKKVLAKNERYYGYYFSLSSRRVENVNGCAAQDAIRFPSWTSYFQNEHSSDETNPFCPGFSVRWAIVLRCIDEMKGILLNRFKNILFSRVLVLVCVHTTTILLSRNNCHGNSRVVARIVGSLFLAMCGCFQITKSELLIWELPERSFKYNGFYFLSPVQCFLSVKKECVSVDPTAVEGTETNTTYRNFLVQ
jgi:hypothetical protein